MRKLIFSLILMAGLIGSAAAQKGGTTVPQVNTLTDRLVAYWKFDETSYGSPVTSFGQLTSTLTANNSPASSTTAKFGRAANLLELDTDYFSMSDNAAVSFGNEDFTITGWYRVDDTSTDRRAIHKGSGIDPSNFAYALRYSSSGNVWRWAISSGSSTTGVNSSTFSSGVFQFVVCYHDSVANTIGISVNGGSFATASWSSGSWDDSGAFYVGLDPSSMTGYDGFIDDVAIWRRMLTAAEIAYLYNGGTGNTPIP